MAKNGFRIQIDYKHFLQKIFLFHEVISNKHSDSWTVVRADKDLKAAEETVRQFQEKNRAFLLGDMSNSMRLPAARIPQVGLELARLTRDVKLQETIYTLLTQQLEQAKIGEAQDMPVVQALDPAVPAIHKSKPKIRLNMALAGAVSLFIGIFLAFFLEYIQRQRQQMANSK